MVPSRNSKEVGVQLFLEITTRKETTSIILASKRQVVTPCQACRGYFSAEDLAGGQQTTVK